MYVNSVWTLQINYKLYTISIYNAIAPSVRFTFLNSCFLVFCPKTLKKISETGASVVRPEEQGQIMVDPYTPGKFWVMADYININEILQYNSLQSEFAW